MSDASYFSGTMFIIYGRYKERQKQGLVAEMCPRCGIVQSFWVVASYTVPHLFFVPFGRFGGDTHLCCSRCDYVMDYQSTRYAWTLPPQAGADYDVSAMASRTTPALTRQAKTGTADRLAAYAGLSSRIAQKATPAEEAARRLTTSGAEGPVADELRKRLADWDSLDDAGREGLLADVDTYSTKAARMLDAISFIKGMATQRPSARSKVAFAAVIILVPWLLSYLPMPAWLGIGLGLVIGIIAGRLLANRVDHDAYQAWFRHTLIPRAATRGIERETLHAVLIELNASSARALMGDVQEVAGHFDDFAVVANIGASATG